MEIFDRVIKLAENEKYNDAIDEITRFLDENPKYKSIDYFHFGNPIEETLYDVYIGNIADIRKLDLEEDLDTIYLVYAISYNETGDFKNAEKYFKTALKINPVSAPVMMNLCEFYQKIGKEEELKDLSHNIMKYAYDVDLLKSSYFKLADYYYHTTDEMELYEHILNFFMQIRAGEPLDDISKSVKYLEEHEIQIGVNPEILMILLYLIDIYEEKNMSNSVDFFKNIFGNLISFQRSVNDLKG